MTEWEYKVVPIVTELQEEREKAMQLPRPLQKLIATPDSQEELLNKYGSEGWELVSTTYIKIQNRIDIIAYLKREKR